VVQPHLLSKHPENSHGRSTTGVVTLLLAAVLFLTTVALGFSMIGRIKDSVGRVTHTYEVRSKIRALHIASSDVMTALETAAVLNDPTSVSKISPDLAKEKSSFEHLRSLTSDNPAQQTRLDQLAPLLAATTSQLSACAGDVPCLPSLPQERQLFFQTLKDRHTDMVNILDTMDTEEQRLLNHRLAAWSSRFEVTVIALAISFLSAVFLVFFNFRLLLREVDRRTRGEQLIREHIDSYRALSGRILELQDTERRKIARELHDSIGQYLAAIKFQLNQLERSRREDSPESARLIAETTDLVDRSLAETRTISHLLHPPLLDELGLYSAARWYVEGFSERSGLEVEFKVDDFVDRMHKDVEIALFRVLQEALTNVHRHSGATRVSIDVSCKDDVAVLLVKDNGHGIPYEILRRYQEGHGGGIGLAGMRERLAELRGTLLVESSSSGTTLRAMLPTNACKSSKQESASAVA
jgi:signal transduction histidine kinase